MALWGLVGWGAGSLFHLWFHHIPRIRHWIGMWAVCRPSQSLCHDPRAIPEWYLRCGWAEYPPGGGSRFDEGVHMFCKNVWVWCKVTLIARIHIPQQAIPCFNVAADWSMIFKRNTLLPALKLHTGTCILKRKIPSRMLFALKYVLRQITLHSATLNQNQSIDYLIQ